MHHCDQLDSREGRGGPNEMKSQEGKEKSLFFIVNPWAFIKNGFLNHFITTCYSCLLPFNAPSHVPNVQYILDTLSNFFFSSGYMRHVIKVSHLPLDGAHFRDEHHYIPKVPSTYVNMTRGGI